MTITAEDTVLSQYVPGFQANLRLAPQQTDTRLLSTVDGELNYATPGQMFNADDVGLLDPEPITTRVPNTPDSFPSFTRRVGMFSPFQDARWLDNVDKARELVDPTNTVMRAIMAGRWRYVDAAIAAAALGPANNVTTTLQGGGLTQTALPAAQVIAGNDTSFNSEAETVPPGFSAGSAYGLSVGKLIHAKMLLQESELEGDLHMALTSQQLADLLRLTPVTSIYYSDVKALVSGTVDNFLGIMFHRLHKNLIPSFAGNAGSPIRQCFAYVQDAIVYRGRPITEATIQIRPDKSRTPQTFYKTEHGGVRRYDTAVVEIDCFEGAPY